APLASVQGHLGKIEKEVFSELFTVNLYYCSAKFLWDMQETVLQYARANDELTGSRFHPRLLAAFDEDGNGVIDYDEMGRKDFWHPIMRVNGKSWEVRTTSPLGFLEAAFRTVSQPLKLSTPRWNSGGHDFTSEWVLVRACWVAFRMSQAAEESKDPLFGVTWGKGKWPSLQFAQYAMAAASLFGPEYPRKPGLLSMYGFAFQYADRKTNSGKFTGRHSAQHPILAYAESVGKGSAPLDFTLFVPSGYGDMSGARLPNVQETEEPGKVFSAAFPAGETW
ncbi:MAG TPA: hypothetical protein VLS90_13620, partial [Thermodesulfobacteriota bacterium]|nr:hypothetical protein [Thermodesulfobacteriota bacterium]